MEYVEFSKRVGM